MKKALIVTFLIFIVLAAGIGGFIAYQKLFAGKTSLTGVDGEPVKLDPEKEATHLSKVAGTPNAYWMRGLPFIWNEIENEKGEFDWSKSDERVQFAKEGKPGEELYHLAIIWPYANWDQAATHTDSKYLSTGHLKEGGEDLRVGAPCDMNAYAGFVEKTVERYDGDGIDDMPGLKTPIKYWEIMNEPEMQGGNVGGAGEDLKFFVGTPEEYLEILKVSYKAIKKADPEAKVAHAGMAGMQRNFQDFWDPVFREGGGEYFDIANIHSISTDEKREDFYVVKFKKYLEKYGIKNKPIWVTEAQIGWLMDKPADLGAFERLLAKASIFSLAQGADKLFYIENWTTWDNPEAFKPDKDKNKGKKEPPPKIDLSKNTTQKVYLNLIDKVNGSDKVEVIKEDFIVGGSEQEGAISIIGQYKFTLGNKVVYVLWGKSELPPEITGTVRVTDIYGDAEEKNAGDIIISDLPIFIEKA